jgi:hypothetical protein
MIDNHLTELEIQEYAFDKENANTSASDHIKSCNSCKAKVATYMLIFSEVKNIPKPVFDYDLQGLVLSGISKPKSRFPFSIVNGYFIAIVTAAILGMIAMLLQSFLGNMFTDIPSSFYYIIVASAILITVFQSIEMYNRFQNKMNRLNLY